MKEIWKDISGYESIYQVSNLGRVKRIVFKNGTTEKLKEKVLKPSDNGKGYKIVGLCKNGKIKNHYIHRLVAEAFIPNPNNYEEVNHKDFNKDNNIIDNLEWVTPLQNTRHYTDSQFAKETNINRGEKLKKIYYDIFIKDKEKYIINMYKNGYNISQIAKKYNLGNNMISKILKENQVEIRKYKNVNIKCYKDGKLVKTFKRYNDIIVFVKNNCNTNAKDLTILHEVKDAITLRRKTNKKYGFVWEK